MEGDSEMIEMKEVKDHVDKHGVSGIEKLIKSKLEGWKDVTMNIAVTGDPGVGKSSFINAIRGIKDQNDQHAAKTGVTETTRDVAVYRHPTNDKINFWDLPGIGTPNYPDLATYCKKVDLEKYDTFLIITANRFTENDLKLAKKVKSLNKPFFFIRAQIDIDCIREKSSLNEAFDEKEMLKKIMDDCLKNLEGLGSSDEDVFLISNYQLTKWDFPRLTEAILDVLPLRQKECLTLSLTCLSAEILRRKEEVLKARIWMVAAASAAGAVFPLPGLSMAVDFALITSEVSFYKTQLGFPDDNSIELPQFGFTTAAQLTALIATYAASSSAEEFVRFIPIVGSLIAVGISFTATYYFLHHYLKELVRAALGLLDELIRKSRRGYAS